METGLKEEAGTTLTPGFQVEKYILGPPGKDGLQGAPGKDGKDLLASQWKDCIWNQINDGKDKGMIRVRICLSFNTVKTVDLASLITLSTKSKNYESLVQITVGFC